MIQPRWSKGLICSRSLACEKSQEFILSAKPKHNAGKPQSPPSRTIVEYGDTTPFEIVVACQ
jgi:hypothetical protein